MNATNAVQSAGFAARAQAFADIHAGQPTGTLVANLHARVETLHSGAGPLPVSVHDARAGDARVCSPRSTYADYAGEEGARYLPGWAAPAALHTLGAAGHLLRAAGVDRAVAINNWLLSTNLYPALAQVDVPALLDEATARWPRHALWFRSLNEHDNADWLRALHGAGARLVASRQVYLYDDLGTLARRHANLGRDLALLQRTPLHYCDDADIEDSDYARIAALYAMLYVGKYSRFNPVYGAEFLSAWHRAGLLEFHGHRDDAGVLQSIAGLFRQGSLATAPIVGYDTAQPRALGLYRLATGGVYRACLEQGWRLNLSAGAAHFKRLRGGRPAVEYSAVFDRHLPGLRRAPLAALSAATCSVGVPLLRRFRL